MNVHLRMSYEMSDEMATSALSLPHPEKEQKSIRVLFFLLLKFKFLHIFWGFLCGAGKGSMKQERQNLALFSVLCLAAITLSFSYPKG